MEYIKSPNKVIQPRSLKEYEDHIKMINLIQRVDILEERIHAIELLNKGRGNFEHGD